MKIIFNVILSLVLALSSFCMVYAADKGITGDVVVNDGKPIIFQRCDTVELAAQANAAAKSGVKYKHGGDVHHKVSENLYYMKGWSTAKGSTGVDLYHYTTADFAPIIGSGSHGAVTEWDTGKVWATSEDVGWEVYDSCYGRISYGL